MPPVIEPRDYVKQAWRVYTGKDVELARYGCTQNCAGCMATAIGQKQAVVVSGAGGCFTGLSKRRRAGGGVCGPRSRPQASQGSGQRSSRLALDELVLEEGLDILEVHALESRRPQEGAPAG